MLRTDRGVFERDSQDSGQDGVGTLRDLEKVLWSPDFGNVVVCCLFQHTGLDRLEFRGS